MDIIFITNNAKLASLGVILEFQEGEIIFSKCHCRVLGSHRIHKIYDGKGKSYLEKNYKELHFQVIYHNISLDGIGDNDIFPSSWLVCIHENISNQRRNY